MEQWFDGICLFLQDRLQPGEDFTANLRAETSDFVRMSHAQVRQPGTVHQIVLDLDWICGQRHTAAQLTLTGQQDEDERRLGATVVTLRERLPLLPEDPYLLWNQTPQSSSRVVPDQLPSGARDDQCHLAGRSGPGFCWPVAAWSNPHWVWQFQGPAQLAVGQQLSFVVFFVQPRRQSGQRRLCRPDL
jgi:hypothetical protein